MKLILHYLKNYKKMFTIDVLSVFGFVLVELGIPTIIAWMIDNGVAKSDSAYIIRMGGLIVLISIAGVAGTILLGYCCAYISTSITRDIRNDIFQKAQTFSHSEFHSFGTSSMITRTNNDAFQIQLFLNILLRTALMTPVMLIMSFVIILKASIDLSLIVLATIPIIVIGVLIVAKLSKSVSEKQQEALEFINRVSKENISGIRVIRSFTNDEYEKKRFDQANSSYVTYSKKIFKMMSVTQPIFFAVMNVAGMIIFWVASQMIDAEALQIGKLVAFMDYLFHAMFSMMLFCLTFMMYPKAEVSAKRISKVLETETTIINPVHGKKADHVDTIEFKHVTFVYPDGEEAVLKDISFQVKKGETIAFIGSTGSGKSTLINLLPRFYDVSEGEVCINGINIKEYDLPSLRDTLGFIPQKAMLFSGSIAENIRYGKKDATQEEMIRAAKTAQAYDFIREKGGFEGLITESATNVSGGQRQRLSITRALVKKPNIYIFDDSFSALDFKTDAKLRKELKKETTQAIVMVVAQRISSIMDADHILVLNEGRVESIGTHQELMKSSMIYREIALSQLSEEELANA